eukprot:CAMPEP_0174230250 /NCGR_PEP_ID=MMETSP0417-20130205/1048_1 /TAXON_ID=242541 /ORGANISM="Mayorella sp, Strain BSH-02190019" /LENGTH=1382 /DNA_ID=CAMNT_0015307901 /DNA_START=138 /DNA_END=4282 /DNA_ORIENTATION=+
MSINSRPPRTSKSTGNLAKITPSSSSEDSSAAIIEVSTKSGEKPNFKRRKATWKRLKGSGGGSSSSSSSAGASSPKKSHQHLNTGTVGRSGGGLRRPLTARLSRRRNTAASTSTSNLNLPRGALLPMHRSSNAPASNDEPSSPPGNADEQSVTTTTNTNTATNHSMLSAEGRSTAADRIRFSESAHDLSTGMKGDSGAGASTSQNVSALPGAVSASSASASAPPHVSSSTTASSSASSGGELSRGKALSADDILSNCISSPSSPTNSPAATRGTTSTSLPLSSSSTHHHQQPAPVTSFTHRAVATSSDRHGLGDQQSAPHSWSDHLYNPYLSVVPPVISQPLSWLEQHALHTEGIFRVSGSYADVDKLKKLYLSDPTGSKVNYDKVNDPHVAGGVVKHFFDDLSHPILTFDLYHCLIASAHIENISMRIECLKHALAILPAGNLAVLKRFFACMVKTESYQENKMTASNLAMVFAPSLLRSADESPAELLRNAAPAVAVITDMINHYKELFLEVSLASSQPRPTEESMKELLQFLPSKFAKPFLAAQKGYYASVQKMEIEQQSLAAQDTLAYSLATLDGLLEDTAKHQQASLCTSDSSTLSSCEDLTVNSGVSEPNSSASWASYDRYIRKLMIAEQKASRLLLELLETYIPHFRTDLVEFQPLFIHLPGIATLHAQLMDSLAKCWIDWPRSSTLDQHVEEHLPTFIVHDLFYRALADFKPALERASVDNPKMIKFLQRTQMRSPSNSRLEDLLAVPFTALVEWKNHFQELVNVVLTHHMDNEVVMSHVKLLSVFRCFSQLYADMEDARQHFTLLQLQKRLSGCELDLAKNRRRLVREGLVAVKSKKLYFHLFTDVLLISKQSGNKFKFISSHMLDTLTLGLPMTTSSKAYARQFAIQTDDGSVLEITLPTNEVKLRWMTDLEVCLRRVKSVVFGLPLAELLRREGHDPESPNCPPPQFVHMVVDSLMRNAISVPGLFCYTRSNYQLESIRIQFDSNVQHKMDMMTVDPHVLTSALTLYLSSLPDPLLEYESFKRKEGKLASPKRTVVVGALRSLLRELSNENRELLSFLLRYFHCVVAAENGVDTKMLALALSPSLMRAFFAKDDFASALDVAFKVRAISLLITFQSSLFERKTTDPLIPLTLRHATDTEQKGSAASAQESSRRAKMSRTVSQPLRSQLKTRSGKRVHKVAVSGASQSPRSSRASPSPSTSPSSERSSSRGSRSRSSGTSSGAVRSKSTHKGLRHHTGDGSSSSSFSASASAASVASRTNRSSSASSPRQHVNHAHTESAASLSGSSDQASAEENGSASLSTSHDDGELSDAQHQERSSRRKERSRALFKEAKEAYESGQSPPPSSSSKSRSKRAGGTRSSSGRRRKQHTLT